MRKVLKSVIFLLLFIAVNFSQLVEGSISTDDPPSACENMTPQHGFGPKNTSAPYFLTLPSNATVKQGNMLKISLNSSLGIGFKGFLVLAFDASNLNGSAIGSFEASDNNSDAFNCSNNYKGIRQMDVDVKTSVVFNWVAPYNFTGPVAFKFTVVQNISTFWVGILCKSIATVVSPPANVLPASGSNGHSSLRGPFSKECLFDDYFTELFTLSCSKSSKVKV